MAGILTSGEYRDANGAALAIGHPIIAAEPWLGDGVERRGRILAFFERPHGRGIGVEYGDGEGARYSAALPLVSYDWDRPAFEPEGD